MNIYNQIAFEGPEEPSIKVFDRITIPCKSWIWYPSQNTVIPNQCHGQIDRNLQSVSEYEWQISEGITCEINYDLLNKVGPYVDVSEDNSNVIMISSTVKSSKGFLALSFVQNKKFSIAITLY